MSDELRAVNIQEGNGKVDGPQKLSPPPDPDPFPTKPVEGNPPIYDPKT